jgi:hypothetical protein
MTEQNQPMTFWLPTKLFQALADAAARQGQTVEELGAAIISASLEKELQQTRNPLTSKALSAPANPDHAAQLAALMQHAGAIDLGYPTGTTNEEIDEDLAREYACSHESPR